MNFDIIPQYNVIFNNDQFTLPKAPGIDEIAYALSFIGYLYTEKDVMNKTFFEESIGGVGIDLSNKKRYLSDKTLITQLGVLRAWKVAFCELKNCSVYNHNFLRLTFNYLYRKIVREQNDYLEKFDGALIQNNIMTSALLNYLDNPSFEFFRTYFFFIKEKKTYKENKKYDDMLNKFYEKYKLTLYEYLEALYIIMCNFEVSFRKLQKTRDLGNNTLLFSLDQINDSETKRKVTIALDMLSFDYVEANKWSCETDSLFLNFQLFQEKPLYKLTNDIYIPVTRKFMQDQIFNSLIYKLRSLYEDSDKSFWELLGELFEEYVVYIFEKLISNCKIKFQLVYEFEYGSKKNRKKSPDLIIILNKNVYVLELKASRPLNDIFQFENNEIPIQKSIDKVVKRPIKQSIKRIDEIIKSQENLNLTNDKKYYFIAISIGSFPIHYSSFQDVIDEIHNSEIKVGGLFNLCIEELELLCTAVAENNKDIAFYLEEYKNYPDQYSFKNYIKQYTNKEIYKVCFNELENDFKTFTDKINL